MVSSKGKLKVNPSRFAEDHRVFNNVGSRDFKVCSEGKKIKVFGRESPGADGIDVAKNPLMPMRKSLQNTEGVHLTDLSNLKGCAKNSDKSTSKGDSSVKVKVGRKVLADVSNVRSYTLRKQSSDGVKLVNNKSETSGFSKGKFHSGRNIYGSRVSVGQSTTIASVSSRKPAMGIMKTSETCGADSKSLKKVDIKIKGFKIYTDHPKTKGRDNGSFETNERKFAKEPLILNRKSLPVKSGPVQIDSNDLKGNVKYSEKCAGNSVKVKVERKVMPAVSNEKSYLWRTRRSDGFILVNCGMDKRSQGIPVDQSIKGASALTKKPLRPIGRTRLTVSGAQTASKPQGLRKSITGTTCASKREEELSRNYVPKNIELVVSDESSQEKVPLQSDGDSYTSAKSTNIISATKYNRRKSFTSSIVARAEVLRVCPEVVKPEELPNIDDNTNHLEVVEYIDDLYQYYWVMEARYGVELRNGIHCSDGNLVKPKNIMMIYSLALAQNPSLANYMVTQTDITAKMRGILINWLIEVHQKFHLMQETLFLMVLLFDKFLSIHTIKKNDVQLVGLTSLLLASKYEDFWHPKVKDLISISAESYTRHQMLTMEKLILKKLMFRLNAPTPYVFMIRFLKASQSGAKLEQLAFYLIELCLVEYEALNFKPSLLCASAIYVARCTLQITPGWTPLLVKHSHYEEPQLRLCASMILRFQKSAGRGSLKVTYEKFMQSDRSCVAAVKPLDRLPQ